MADHLSAEVGRTVGSSPRSTAGLGAQLKPMAGELLGSGAEADVIVAHDPRFVIKRFHPGPHAPHRVREEEAVLAKLAATRDSWPPSVRFPLLNAVRPEQGEIEMERGPALTVLEASSEAPLPTSAAEAIADGLEHYVSVAGMAFHDFGAVNVMWDGRAGEVWFIDVASEATYSAPADLPGQIAHSLGYYLGVLAYEMSRPWRRSRLRTARRLTATFVSMAARLQSRQVLGPTALIERTAWLQFRASAREGSRARRVWYETAGAAIGGLIIRAAIAQVRQV